MKTTTTCPPCNGDCQQGRACPAPQACELPIDFAGPEPRDGWDIATAWAQWFICCVLFLCALFAAGAFIDYFFFR